MQQFSFIDLFIDLFVSAVHVSGDKLAHPQEHFLTIYTAFGTMHRHCCRPVILSPVGTNIGTLCCTRAVETVKSAPEGGRVCRPKLVEQIHIDQ